MGEIDKSIKAYLKIPGIFAQFFNEGVFLERIVDPDDLRELDSVQGVELEGALEESVPDTCAIPKLNAGKKAVRHSGRKNSGRYQHKRRKRMHRKYIWLERIRDISMESQVGTKYRIILATEEQTDIHYYMPVRVMQVDALRYESQCRMKVAEAREHGENFSPVQGMPSGTRILPVLTVVLYLGEKPWDGPVNLYDMFQVPEEEKAWLRRYVPDYPIKLIDARHMDEKALEQFHGDLRIFFTLLRENYDEQQVRGMTVTHPETFKVLGTVKGDDRYRQLAEEQEKSGTEGGEKMDAMLDKIEQRGINYFSQLVVKLTEAGRSDDILKAAKDSEYQKKLFQEFGIGEKPCVIKE